MFDLEVEGGDDEQVRRIAGEIAEKVLSNPLIESYEVELVGAMTRVGVVGFPGVVRRPRRDARRRD